MRFIRRKRFYRRKTDALYLSEQLCYEVARIIQPMLAELKWKGKPLQIDLATGRSLAIPLVPGGPQPAFFAATSMQSEPLENGDFVGDVRQGGSCNAEILHWAPHCHGTHTEGVGHILEDRVSVLDSIDTLPGLAYVFTVNAPNGEISRTAIERNAGEIFTDVTALILRTQPNPESKQWRDYTVEPDYPVLTAEAMQWLSRLPLKHLLLDTPSLDSMSNPDLSNHRVWWGEGLEDHGLGFNPQSRSITEMIFVADDIPDGEYWLHIELSPLVSDATPSRPMIFPVTRGS